VKNSRERVEMPRVKKPKRKPIAYSCLYDRGVYEVYADDIFVSSFETQREAKIEARRLKKPRPCHSQVIINYKSVCTYGPEVCRYWKSCVEVKGTTFTQPWGKKKLILLEMKRHPQPEPKKEKELNQFF